MIINNDDQHTYFRLMLAMEFEYSTGTLSHPYSVVLTTKKHNSEELHPICKQHYDQKIWVIVIMINKPFTKLYLSWAIIHTQMLNSLITLAAKLSHKTCHITLGIFMAGQLIYAYSSKCTSSSSSIVHMMKQTVVKDKPHKCREFPWHEQWLICWYMADFACVKVSPLLLPT